MEHKATTRDAVVVSRAMRAVRSSGTAPEVALRKRLWRAGLRYRLGRALPGRPDLVFPAQGAVVFMDGDFWHGRQWKQRGFESLESQMGRVHGGAYWIDKITRNIRRDEQINITLREAGWKVIRVWESDFKANPEAETTRIVQAVRCIQ
jgi:DNA mismatch endonuclease (patch repair protein)